jgi:peroxiredoxin
MRGRTWFSGGILCALILAVPVSASPFALRGLAQGDKVSDMAMAGISGKGGTLASFAGKKGLVVVYWATWSSRSTELLSFFEQERKRYKALGLSFLAVNADREEMKPEEIAAVRSKARELALSFPVVVDAGLRGYNETGIMRVPTTLFLRPDLTLADVYPGFPSVARVDIPARLDAFLGIDREQSTGKSRSLEERTPKNDALAYYDQGKATYLGSRSPSGELHGVPGTAIGRLDEAIRRDPDFFRPYLLKAILYDLAKAAKKRDEALQELERHDFQEVHERRLLGFGYLYMGLDAPAEEVFQLLSSQAPEDPGVLFGQAVSSARAGDAASVTKALEALGRNPKAAKELGFDYAPLFTPDGGMAPQAEPGVKQALEKLLGIEKPTDGANRGTEKNAYRPRAPASIYSFAALAAVAASPAPAAMSRSFPG